MQGFVDGTYLLNKTYTVYILYWNDEIQYVGISTCVESRIHQHRTKKAIRFNRVMIKRCVSQAEMEGLEHELICVYKPPHNVKAAYAREYIKIDLSSLGFNANRTKGLRRI